MIALLAITLTVVAAIGLLLVYLTLQILELARLVRFLIYGTGKESP